MKAHLLRVGSIVPHGVGGKEAGFIDFIYSYLLNEFGQAVYNHISINQIGPDLNEFIAKEPGNKIHINIRYPVYDDFEQKNVIERNRIRVDVVHTALQRIAEFDNKLDIEKLEAIKNNIIESDFKFDIVYKVHINKKTPNLVAQVLISPSFEKFDFSVLIEENDTQKCKINIFRGRPSSYYMDRYFSIGKWKSENLLIISGKEKIVELHILVDKCELKIVNLTPYDKPPYFELMRADISEEERMKAKKDWEHSLPPATAAIIRRANN